MSNPTQHVRKRSVLIALLVAVQFVCLIVGLFLFANLFTTRLNETLRKNVLANNRQIATQAAAFIRELDPQDLSAGSNDWRRLQKFVEEFELPHEGVLCLIRSSDGSLFCHPKLTQGEELTTPGEAVITMPDGRKNIRFADGVGWANLQDGKHLIAVVPLHRYGLRVLVQQRVSAIQRETSHITSPIWPLGLTTVLLVTSLTTATALAVTQRYENKLANVNENLERQVFQRTNALTKTRNATIFGLAKLAESRDTDTGDHLDRIRSFVTILAKRLQSDDRSLTNEYIETLGVASSLHDIGKVGIPDSVLLKPGRLDEEEREIMETHAAIGADCLAAIIDRLGEDDFLTVAHEIALWHHEKYDGTGYPTRLSGTAIPLSARIVALADVYDALISPRVYKKPMSHEEARKIIVEGAGKHFDPTITEAFLTSEDEFERITKEFHCKLGVTEGDLSNVPIPPLQAAQPSSSSLCLNFAKE